MFYFFISQINIKFYYFLLNLNNIMFQIIQKKIKLMKFPIKIFTQKFNNQIHVFVLII